MTAPASLPVDAEPVIDLPVPRPLVSVYLVAHRAGFRITSPGQDSTVVASMLDTLQRDVADFGLWPHAVAGFADGMICALATDGRTRIDQARAYFCALPQFANGDW